MIAIENILIIFKLWRIENFQRDRDLIFRLLFQKNFWIWTNLVRGLPYARHRKYPYSLSFLHVSFSCCFMVMFSQVSVCPRGGACSIACWDTHPQPRDQRQTPPWADTPWAETPWVNTPLDRHPHRQRPPCSVHSGIRSTSGRYASHWNAFLFWNVLSLCRSTITLSQDNFWRANTRARDKGISILYIWIQSRQAPRNLFTKACF